MKTPPIEPGIYLHLEVGRTANEVRKSRVHVYRVEEEGRFWHPVCLSRREMRGSFIRIPDELHEEAFAEAKEVFVEEKAKDILRLDRWDRRGYLNDVAEDMRPLVEAKLAELDPTWAGGR